MKGLLKELFRVSGCGIGFTHLVPHRRYDRQASKEWCRDTLGQVTQVIAVFKDIPP